MAAIVHHFLKVVLWVSIAALVVPVLIALLAFVLVVGLVILFTPVSRLERLREFFAGKKREVKKVRKVHPAFE